MRKEKIILAGLAGIVLGVIIFLLISPKTADACIPCEERCDCGCADPESPCGGCKSCSPSTTTSANTGGGGELCENAQGAVVRCKATEECTSTGCKPKSAVPKCPESADSCSGTPKQCCGASCCKPPTPGVDPPDEDGCGVGWYSCGAQMKSCCQYGSATTTISGSSSGGGAGSCNDNGFNNRECMPAKGQMPEGKWAEDQHLACGNSDTCCGASTWCIVELVNQTTSCNNTKTAERRCRYNLTVNGQNYEMGYPLPGDGWEYNNSIACNPNGDCCPNYGKCWEREFSPLNGINITITPLSSDGKLRTYCKAEVEVTQDNGLPCFSNKTLIITKNGTRPDTLTQRLAYSNRTDGACTWVWNLTGIESQGTYNFSLYNASMHIKSKAIGASNLADVPSCIPYYSNCTKFCMANSSFSENFIGCGTAPCGPIQGKFYKDCGDNNCGNITYCKEFSPCVPKVSVSKNIFESPGLGQAVKMSAQANFTSVAPNYVEFFLDGVSGGRDSYYPYESNSLLVRPGTNHTYWAVASFYYGNFDSLRKNFSVPAETPNPPRISCNKTCMEWSNCTCTISNCASFRDVSITTQFDTYPRNVYLADSEVAFTAQVVGNHSVSVNCIENELHVPVTISDWLHVERVPVYFTLGSDSTFGIPDNSHASISLASTRAVPVEVVIMGAGAPGYASSEIYSSEGWTGKNTIEFGNISYYGSGPYTLYLFVYPVSGYSGIPANFAYSRQLVTVN